MASVLHPCILLLFSSFLSLTHSSSPHQRHLLQSSSSPHNIETFFPSIASPAFINQKIPPPPRPPISQPGSTAASNSTDHNKITKAVIATAACSFAISFLIFYIFHWFSIKKHRQRLKVYDSQRGSSKQEMIVDENGLDVLYWRNLVGGSRCNYCNCIFDQFSVDPSHQQSLISSSDVKYDRKVQEQPLIPLNSVSSSAYASKASDSGCSSLKSLQSGVTPIAPPPSPAPPPPPPSLPPPPPPPTPPPPPPMMKKNPAPPPAMPPRPPTTKNSMAAAAPSRPPLVPPLPAEGGRGRAKLKPLHWDKVTPPNAEHSMVWDKISDGSFRIDDDLMDTLFGYSSTNQTNSSSNKSTPPNPSRPSSTPSATQTQTILLDPRKSQNIAIVVRSLGIGHKEILDALLNGHGLNIEALEKLSRITLTKEEETKILNFTDNPKNLAGAESFIYHLLKSVPSPFVRINAMLFKSNYDSEILHLKKSIQTLELASKEIKSHSLFLKLLEAILKAGNRMNAGTARGNAKAFNLSALCKLSDVKSADGKTTLLHFVVEEVVRSEGKRLVINRNHSLRRSGSSSSNYSGNLQANKTTKEEKEKEYIKLGLPVVGGLGEELVNVKKAAAIDYDTLDASCSSLGAKIGEIREFLRSCNVGDGFLKEMKGFLEASEEELKVVIEEFNRVMELVKRTTEYYQAGSSKDNSTQALQLFVIIRDFLVMFDRVCIDITRNMQKKVVPKAKEETEKRPVARFRNLPPHFMSENSKSSSSDSDSEDGF